MMKKILFLILTVSIFYNADFCIGMQAQDKIKSQIEIIEKETNTYMGENIPLEERLKNIEIYVFGVAKKGDMNERLSSVSKTLGIPLEQNEESLPKYEIEDDALANYPSVDKLEQQYFSKTYKNENIYARLDRLEKKVMGKTSSKSLNERVLDLQERSGVSVKLAKEEDIPYTKANSGYTYSSKDYNYYSAADPVIATLEQKLLKNTYENEPVSKRLSRLEYKIFGQNFDDDNDSTRLERIKSVIKASKSGSEYKANKFAKYAATGIQIGGIILLILAMIL